MNVYTGGLPDMEEMPRDALAPSKGLQAVAAAAGPDAIAALEASPMRCGGCGAKVRRRPAVWPLRIRPTGKRHPRTLFCSVLVAATVTTPAFHAYIAITNHEIQ